MEIALHGKEAVETHLARVWKTMRRPLIMVCIQKDYLPGPLKVPRRAASLAVMLQANQSLSNDPMRIIDWVNMFALAVNEENAAGGRVVTAPTNGACGILTAGIGILQSLHLAGYTGNYRTLFTCFAALSAHYIK